MHPARTAALVVLTVAAAACAKNESAADSARADSAMAAAPANPAMPSGDTTANAATAAGGLTDANIVYILDQANIADSARGKLAETKGTSADVKAFGRLMAGEHHSLRAQGQELAKKLNVTPQAPAGDQSEAQAKAEMDSLTAMAKGNAWDKSYIDYEVNYHQAVIETATKALGAAQNQELKDLIQKAAPILQHHLDRAKEIQGKL
jgi:putative membrane protein